MKPLVPLPPAPVLDHIRRRKYNIHMHDHIWSDSVLCVIFTFYFKRHRLLPPHNNGLGVDDGWDPLAYWGVPTDERGRLLAEEGDGDPTVEGNGDSPPDGVGGSEFALRASIDLYGELVEMDDEEHLEIMELIRQLDGNDEVSTIINKDN